jgi:hypothetical protein
MAAGGASPPPPEHETRRSIMSNRRRKSIGQRKIREALERRLSRGRAKAEARALRVAARELRAKAEEQGGES